MGHLTANGQDDDLSELRVWNDIRGNEITARFVRYREGLVYLRTNTRRSVKIQPNQLSSKDCDYISKLLRDRKKDKLADEFDRLASSKQRAGRGGNPSGGQSGAATPGGNPSTPGNFPPPMKTPLGESPSAGGGSTNRAPSPYVKTPEEDGWNSRPPKNTPPKKDMGGFDPFGESNSKPSSDSSVSKVENPGIDPFAEVESNDGFSDSRSPTTFNEQTSTTGSSYQPPVVANKSDDTVVVIEETDTQNAENEKGSWNQTILIALAVICLLLLVMIGLLTAVLARARQAQPRGGYY